MPDEGGKLMELQQDGPVLLKSSFSSSAGRPSGPTAFAFAIAFIAVAISSPCTQSRGHSRLVAAAASSGCRDRACRI